MLFGPILGINHQSVRATATAIAGSGNATDCLRPIAFADDWDDIRDDPPAGVEFWRYAEPGPGTPVANADDVHGSERDAGWAHNDLGRSWRAHHLGSRPCSTTATTTPITRNMVVGLTLPGGRHVLGKHGELQRPLVQLGQTLPVEIPPAGDTQTAFTNMIAADPSVVWNAGSYSHRQQLRAAMRLRQPEADSVALYDPDRFQLGRATNDWAQPASAVRPIARASPSRTLSASSFTGRTADMDPTATS